MKISVTIVIGYCCVNVLRNLGNENVELLTTTGKGYDRMGVRNCHSWTIVDEMALRDWIVSQLE